MPIFKTPARNYDLLATEFVCNKFGLAEFFAEQFSANVLAVDINPQAIACCRENVAQFNLAEKISVVEGNFANLYETFKKNSFELIISNPPLEINSAANLNFAGESFGAMNYAKYQFLTNSWRDERGFDLTEYILVAGNPAQCIKSKAAKYNYNVALLCENKIPVANLGINFLDRNFVNGYIWLLS